MNAEDTAFVAIQFWCDDPDGTDEDLRSIIAAAIRTAENDALDRAVAECQRIEAEANGNPAEQAGAFHCALAITAIKHRGP